MGLTVLIVLVAVVAAALFLREPIAELRKRRRERAQERKRQWRRDREAERARRRVERAMNPAKAAARRGPPRWQQVAQRQGSKCWLCGTRTHADDMRRIDVGEVRLGATYPAVDYVVPLDRGGTYEMDNLRIAHRHCQSRRATTGPGATFGAPRRTYPA